MNKKKAGLILVAVGALCLIVFLGAKEKFGKTSAQTTPLPSETSNICEKEGCQEEKGNNGTDYCNTHAAEYAKEQGYETCLRSKCYARCVDGSKYCSDHICSVSDCKNGAAAGSIFCSKHKIQTISKSSKKTTGSTSKTSKKKTKSTSKSSKKKSSSKSSSKSSKKISQDSYDKGYEDVYEDDDYDTDRYNSDSSYANGVDDAIEDYEEEEGEDW